VCVVFLTPCDPPLRALYTHQAQNPSRHTVQPAHTSTAGRWETCLAYTPAQTAPFPASCACLWKAASAGMHGLRGSTSGVPRDGMHSLGGGLPLLGACSVHVGLTLPPDPATPALQAHPTHMRRGALSGCLTQAWCSAGGASSRTDGMRSGLASLSSS
jgi:hypothetical protein